MNVWKNQECACKNGTLASHSDCHQKDRDILFCQTPYNPRDENSGVDIEINYNRYKCAGTTDINTKTANCKGGWGHDKDDVTRNQVVFVKPFHEFECLYLKGHRKNVRMICILNIYPTN